MIIYKYACPKCNSILPEPVVMTVDPPIEQYSCIVCNSRWRKRTNTERVILPLADKAGYEYLGGEAR